jgi:predicted ATP-dependent endonuclease of OLD family
LCQADLLRYIEEKLKPDHQVIFTTHSPFMVPADRLDWVRTVEDVVVQKGQKFVSVGTRVGGDVLSTDRDTLFPLQAALGYEITQSLFVGEHTLLVEGPSDILYLKAASNALSAAMDSLPFERHRQGRRIPQPIRRQQTACRRNTRLRQRAKGESGPV